LAGLDGFDFDYSSVMRCCFKRISNLIDPLLPLGQLLSKSFSLTVEVS
jgi:hypothetical protein